MQRFKNAISAAAYIAALAITVYGATYDLPTLTTVGFVGLVTSYIINRKDRT